MMKLRSFVAQWCHFRKLALNISSDILAARVESVCSARRCFIMTAASATKDAPMSAMFGTCLLVEGGGGGGCLRSDTSARGFTILEGPPGAWAWLAHAHIYIRYDKHALAIGMISCQLNTHDFLFAPFWHPSKSSTSLSVSQMLCALTICGHGHRRFHRRLLN